MINYIYTYDNSRSNIKHHKNQVLYHLYYISLLNKLNDHQYILIGTKLYREYVNSELVSRTADQIFLNQYELINTIKQRKYKKNC